MVLGFSTDRPAASSVRGGEEFKKKLTHVKGLGLDRGLFRREGGYHSVLKSWALRAKGFGGRGT